MNLVKLKNQKKSDRIPVQDWPFHEWESLDDLGFNMSSDTIMEFGHSETTNGDEKSIRIKIFKKKNIWFLTLIKNKKNPIIKKINDYDKLMKVLYNIFETF